MYFRYLYDMILMQLLVIIAIVAGANNRNSNMKTTTDKRFLMLGIIS